MTDQEDLKALAARASWFPFDFDPAQERLTFVELGEEQLRADAFLDQRALPPFPSARLAHWSDVVRLLPSEARADAHYIFHLGNVGSTLISRLLGEIHGVLPLREPLVLRALADAIPLGLWSADEAASRIGTINQLLSRGFRPGQRAMVKATSFVSEIAGLVLPPGSRALFLRATPAHYVENILAGENSRAMLAWHTPRRLARLARRTPGLIAEGDWLGEARQAALGWACEASALEEAASALGHRQVLWLDFDGFLRKPTSGLLSLAEHFELPLDPTRAAAIAEGPLMRRYSKALEYEYSPQLRAELLSQARQRHRREIDDALGWLGDLASRYPALASALRRGQASVGQS